MSWKKKFDDNNDIRQKESGSSDPNLSMYDDILRMQTKIKNMHNRKCAKEDRKYNYKNIELFQNIYQKVIDAVDGEDSEDIVEDLNNYNESLIDEGPTDDDVDEYLRYNANDKYNVHFDSDSDDESVEKEGFVIEGMKSKKKKAKKKATAAAAAKQASGGSASGGSAPSSSGGASSKNFEIKSFNDLVKATTLGIAKVSLGISETLFYVPKSIDTSLSNDTNNFAKMFSEKDAPPNRVKKDASILKDFIYQLVAFVIAIWVAMNWFFIMIFKTGGVEKCGNTDDGTGRCYFANDENRFKINFDGSGKMQSLFEFLFDFCITPAWTFDRYVMGDNYGKKLFTHIPWKIISYFILFVLSFILVYAYDFFSSIKDTIEGKISSLNTFATITIVILLFNKTIVKAFFEKMTGGAENIATMVMKNMSPLTWIFIQLVYFVVLMGIAFFSINISVIILVLFVWLLSLFAIPYYKGIGDIGITLRNMYKYMSEDFGNEEEKYEDKGILRVLMRMFARGIHDNMYAIGFIMLMIYNLLKMNVSLNSVRLKQIMTVLMVSLIGITITFIAGKGSPPTTVAFNTIPTCAGTECGPE